MNNSYYDLLNCNKNTSADDIRKSYRKLILKCHPDKGGSEEEFKKINNAYETLIDDEKRKNYDIYGENKPTQQRQYPHQHQQHPHQHQQHPHQQQRQHPYQHQQQSAQHQYQHYRQKYNSFFNFNNFTTKEKKCEDIKINETITLEECYNGIKTIININCNKLCTTCNGHGNISVNQKNNCHECHGSGTKVHIIQYGPNIIQKTETCSHCNGQGKIYDDKYKCLVCKGCGTNNKMVSFNLEIPPGIDNDSIFTVKDIGNEKLNYINGNLIITIKVINDFYELKRSGADLLLEKNITLKEALCGFDFNIKYFNNRIIRVLSNVGEVIKPFDIKTLKGEGLIANKSDLNIKFNIIFPEILSEYQIEELKKLF